MTADPFPRSIETERAVLGALLLEPERLDDVVGIINANAFFRADHSAVFKLLVDRRRRGEPLDWVSVLSAADTGTIPFTGDQLRELTSEIAHAEDVVCHAEVVADLWRRRQLITELSDTTRLLQDTGRASSETGWGLHRRIQEIIEGTSKPAATRLGDVARVAVAELKQSAGDEQRGLPTAWPELDSMLGGLEPGRLIVVAARTGTGKSAFIMNMVRSVAGAGHGAMIFSLEMNDEELAYRQLASETGIPSDQLSRSPQTLIDHQWESLDKAVDALSNLNIYVETNASRTIDQIFDIARIYVRRHNVGLIVVDHIGLVKQDRDQARHSRQQLIGAYTRTLKIMSKDLGVPVIAVSQLNRDSETENRPPRLSDLRESGDVEQDADIVLMIHRDKEVSSTETQVYVRKNRSGRIGQITLDFDAAVTTFRSRYSY